MFSCFHTNGRESRNQQVAAGDKTGLQLQKDRQTESERERERERAIERISVTQYKDVVR